MEIEYNNYEDGIKELECLKSVTLLLPHAAIKVNKLRKEGKEKEANALEYEQRFKFWMKRCEKDWHYRDPRGEQSLSQFSHDELGRYLYSLEEENKGKSK